MRDILNRPKTTLRFVRDGCRRQAVRVHREMESLGRLLEGETVSGPGEITRDPLRWAGSIDGEVFGFIEPPIEAGSVGTAP